MKSLDAVLDTFYEVAAAACDHIAEQSPDLVIALMQAGRFPLAATQSLWQLTQQRPFPPVLLTNIGTEKMRRYEELCHAIEFNDYLHHNIDLWGKGHNFDSQHRETGHLLAWVHNQRTWLDELGHQVEQILGHDCIPQRILVLEDFIQDGRSCLLTHGLLHALYPECAVLMLSGTVSDWRDRAAAAWLESQGRPELKSVLAEDTYTIEYDLKRNGLYRLNRVAAGTEDVEREGLAWKWLTLENGHVQGLSPHLTFERCVALSGWIERTIASHIQQTAGRWYAGAARNVRRAGLYVEQLLSAYLWLHGSSAPDAAAAWAGTSAAEATRIFDAFVDEGWAVWREREGEFCCDLVRRGLLLYGAAAHSPDPYLLAITEHMTETRTPFPVEFARTNGQMGPYLIPVPEGNGAPIPARLLHLIPDIDEDEARDRLMHQESRLLGGYRIQYFAENEKAAADPIFIHEIGAMEGVDVIYYAQALPNIPGILNDDLSPEAKAKVLAQIALESEKVAGERDVDGLAYLTQALAQGIETPLTALYRQKVEAARVITGGEATIPG